MMANLLFFCNFTTFLQIFTFSTNNFTFRSILLCLLFVQHESSVTSYQTFQTKPVAFNFQVLQYYDYAASMPLFNYKCLTLIFSKDSSEAGAKQQH